ncbi:hypothetical protein NPS01_42010 [Nocardioides psychrotolerans]|uniref:RNA polymerase sigma-70 factor, ECF subfamily n=1 Tax=Nocardioides psychrotolerans TaxID=1005945 RepID=A0A1I3DNX2_9ACTN|nr:sigma factor [Nocardioides psychrotolerans]GEP40538.1 hypothetical protein NPS01_42010 [Nocardioides psychrotolerans]SFH88406.1 RNA polymerase sigma-70 factor, ECF subfamily [Nocardioides psychrotolerans]
MHEGQEERQSTHDVTTLLRRTACQDKQAFAALYDATSARAFALACRLVGDPARAERVTQEAYLTVWRTAPRFDPSSRSGLAWVMAVVHGVARSSA